MTSKAAVTYFAKTLSKLDSLIAKLEVRTGITQELLRSGTGVPQVLVKAAENQNAAPEQAPKVSSDKEAAPKQEKNQKTKEAKPKKEAPAKKEEEKQDTPAQLQPEDFAKLDIRVGRIIDCWRHPESEKLYCEKIDIGDEVREIGSGLQQFVPLEEMTQDLVLVLANLKARKLAGFNSHGMVLCASNTEHTKIELMRPAPGSKLGERVTLDGLDKIPQDKVAPIDTKKNKALETVLPNLKTDSNGYAEFLGYKLKTSAGHVKSKTLTNANIS